MHGALPADNNFFIQLLWRLIKEYLHIFKSTWHIWIYFCWYSDAVTSNSLQSMNCSTPGSPVHHYLPEFAKIHVHWHKFFPISWLFVSGGQIIGVSVSTSVLPMNTQDWFPLGLTGRISLQSKGLSRVFSNTKCGNIWQHQMYSRESINS